MKLYLHLLKESELRFSSIEEAKYLVECDHLQQEFRRGQKRRKRRYDGYFGTNMTDPNIESQTPSIWFETQTFMVIIYSLTLAISKRLNAYKR